MSDGGLVDAIVNGRSAIHDLFGNLKAHLVVRKTDFTGQLRSREHVTLSGLVDLRGLSLSPVAMTECRLTNADFRGSSLAFGRFLQCDFSGSELGGVALEKADFSGSKLHNTMLSGADCESGIFVDADCVDASFRSAVLIRSDFSGAVLQGVDFRAANCQEASFRDANLESANMRNAYFHQCDLSGANLSGVDVTSYYQERAGRVVAVAVTDLSNAKGLTQQQLESMIGDAHTHVPRTLKRPSSWTLGADEAGEKTDLFLEPGQDHLVGSSAQAAELGDAVETVRANKNNIELVSASLMLMVDEEMDRLRGWNVADDQEMERKESALEFLVAARNCSKELLYLSNNVDEAADTARASLIEEFSKLFVDWLNKNKEEMVDSTIRFSIVALIGLLSGYGGAVIPLAGIAFFGGDKVKSMLPKIAKS